MTDILGTLERLYGEAAARRRLGPSQMLFAAGDPVSRFYVIETGRMHLSRHGADGAPMTLYEARDGETVAEASLFSETFHCDAVAVTPTVVCGFSKPRLRAAMRRDGDTALLLMAHLARQVQSLRGHVQLMTVKSAPDRILAYLQGRTRAETQTVTIDRTWKAIAAEIGLTHEAVYRALARLERDGTIRRTGDQVEIRRAAR